jgi:hypothetical protein
MSRTWSRKFLRPTLAALALLAAPACDPGDDPELVRQDLSSGLTGPTSGLLYGGHYALREWRATCAPSCAAVKTTYRNTKSGQKIPVRTCTKYNNDCPTFKANAIYEAPGSSNIASGMVDFPDDPSIPAFYVGCGPKAAQNVLGFFGVREPITAFPAYIKTINFGLISLYYTDGIATLPDDLADGLRRVLNEKGDGTFTVTRKSGVDMMGEIRSSIDRGLPIIALAQDGSHFVMVTGYNLDHGSLFVSDYPYSNDRPHPAREVSLYDPLLDFTTPSTLWIHPGHWLDKTVVTVEHLGHVPPQSGLFKASNDPTVYSLNGIEACAVSWDQYVALHKPAFTTMTPEDSQNFVTSFYRDQPCSNGGAGLAPYDKGFFKASDSATIYSLNGVHACAVTWNQFVTLGQPGFTTLSPDQMRRFKDDFGGSALCANRDLGI